MPESSGFPPCDLVVAGAGLFGLTVAERAARELGLRVLVLERRPHIAGNCFTEADPDTGTEVHRYGSHIFHCTHRGIWDYVNRFTRFNGYRHHVFTVHRGHLYAMPINLLTISAFFGRAMRPAEARALIAGQAAELGDRVPGNFEEKAISLIGRPLYEAFIRGYTQKQWDTDPRLLPADIITRLPVRLTTEARYFSDRFEGIPEDGYTAMCERMADHPGIAVRLRVDFLAVRDRLPRGVPVVYTGPIDRYFEYRLGRLSWRSVRFERELVAEGDFQGTAVVNYADPEVPFTRIHEYHHYHPEKPHPEDRTVIFREYSAFTGTDNEPAYPIRTAENTKIFEAYRALAEAEEGVIFGGRLGTYRYLDMHQAVGGALACFEKKVRPHFTEGRPGIGGLA